MRLPCTMLNINPYIISTSLSEQRIHRTQESVFETMQLANDICKAIKILSAPLLLVIYIILRGLLALLDQQSRNRSHRDDFKKRLYYGNMKSP